MSLSNIQIIRLETGDTEIDNYILTDDQIEYYLTINSDNIENTVSDVKAAISQILSVRAVSVRTEDMWLDSRDIAKRYNESLQTISTLKGIKASPIITGGEYKGATVDQFDDENDFNTDNTFYNA